MRRGNPEPVSQELRAQILMLEAMGDENIDLSDMPEVMDWSRAVEDESLGKRGNAAESSRRIALPEPVADIYRAVEALERRYVGRRFTPDGHLVGSIGEVVAAEALGLTLRPMSYPGHDAVDAEGRDVQIKMTGGTSVSMYATSNRLIVLRVVTPEWAEIVYDGPGRPAWEDAGKLQKNGQCRISLARLRTIAAAHASSAGA